MTLLTGQPTFARIEFLERLVSTLTKAAPCSPDCKGWDVFEIGDDPDLPRFKLQKCDECDRFADDHAAELHVGHLLLKLQNADFVPWLVSQAEDDLRDPANHVFDLEQF